MSKKLDFGIGSCNKVPFASRKVAEKTMQKINLDPDSKLRTPLKSVHYCEHHRAWHLSSMSQELANTIQERKEVRETLKQPSLNTIQNRIEYLKTVPRLRNKFNP